jgi:hypothetical protein
MDDNYVKTHMAYCPLVCFDTSCNNYIPYSLFHNTQDIKFFQSLKFVTNVPKKNKKHYQQQGQ